MSTKIFLIKYSTLNSIGPFAFKVVLSTTRYTSSHSWLRKLQHLHCFHHQCTTPTPNLTNQPFQCEHHFSSYSSQNCLFVFGSNNSLITVMTENKRNSNVHELLQELQALSETLYQSHSSDRTRITTTSLALPRSGASPFVSSAEDGNDTAKVNNKQNNKIRSRTNLKVKQVKYSF